MRARRAPAPILWLLSAALLCATFAHAQIAFDKVTSATPLPNGIELHSGPLVLRITALRDDLLRIRAGRNTLPEDASWAVLPASRTATVNVTQDPHGFHTATLRVNVDPITGLLTLRDLAGNILQQDAHPLRFDGPRVTLATTMPPDEHFFGLGDKTGPFDRRGESFRMWNTDAYAWQESTDPLYKSIPFYISYRAGTALGVLVDNTWPSTFDFGKTDDAAMLYTGEGSTLDEYILYGPSTKQVLAQYAWLTGPTPLPPLWSLGFQQSRYSYMTQARVLEVAARLRTDNFPADAIYLDIDYQQNNRPFTVNTATFPDLPSLIATLHNEKMHVVAITDPHIADLPNHSYAPYDTGLSANHFVKNPDGSIYSGRVWPGPSVFPDFTRKLTRQWWGNLYTGFTKLGIDGFWNDMGEPSVFNPHLTMPDNVLHRIDEPGFLPRTATHREIHNLYGMQNSRATFDGQLALRPNIRPFVLTRATYAGGQRYAATWTGDNSATWNHLRLTTPMLKNLGLSGFSLVGADVGGYAGTPSADLLTKWMEIAAFQPIDRVHSEKGTGDHEPWANGPEHEAIRRRFVEQRYRLLPYLYTVMEQGTHTGLPLLRPIFLEFPDATPDRHPLDIDVDASGQFMVGPDLLVAPAPFPDKQDDYEAKLPSTGWYDFWTGQHVGEILPRTLAPWMDPEAAKTPAMPIVKIHPTLETLPVFVRPGAILPIAPLTQSTQDQPHGPLTLRVFPGENCAGSLYQDDGATFAYKQGQFLKMFFTCEVSSGALHIHISKHKGAYLPWWQHILIEVNGMSAAPSTATINGHTITAAYDNHRVILDALDNGNGIEAVLQ